MGCHAIEFSKENKSSKTTRMTAFDCYKTYLAIKQHFTQPAYDYFRYYGATSASMTSFNRRKDKYFFEKMSRQKTDSEIKEYFVAILFIRLIHNQFGLVKLSKKVKIIIIHG